MKMIKNLIFLSAMAAFVMSCSNAPKGEKAATGEKAAVAEAATTDKSFTINTANSMINWSGSKVGGTHTGILKLSDGNVSVKGDKVTGGKFTIDMGSIACTDMAADEGGDKLVGHLASEDFFNVAAHPTSTFEITKVTGLTGNADSNSMIYGNLTMLGVTKEVGFKANIKIAGDGLKVTSPDFTIDRTDFGLKYGSSKFFDDLKDKAINDNIGLSLNITS